MNSKIKFCVLLTQLFLTQFGQAQGTLVFDQESSSNETIVGGGGWIQDLAPYGQSFTPSFSYVGFVRLSLFDVNPNNGIGASLALNLRANTINGSTLATTSLVYLTDGFSGFASFFFPSNVMVTAGATYVYEIVVQSGSDAWKATVSEYNYSGGTVFAYGAATGGMADMWFREGIIVPEPSSVALLFGGISAVIFARRKRIWKQR